MGRGQKLAQALSAKYPESFSAEAPGAEDELTRLMREMEFYRLMETISQDVAQARQPSAPSFSSDSDWTDNWSDGGGGGGGFSDSDGGSDSGSGGDFID